LRYDSTPTFYREIEGFKKRQSGAVIGIAGPKMSGKSRLGQMLLTRFVDTQPHVLFQYKDLEHHVKERDDLSIAIQIDEDLKATGHESRNLVVHVNNSFETSRKADLWAVCTGVNLNFKDWGNTLDIRMIPFGFNVDYQATRAAMFDCDNNFLGFAVFQREHLPGDGVFYYNEEGLWGEYEARAKAYSLTVTKKGGVQDAVDALTQTEHIKTLKQLFKTDYIKKGLAIPNDVMCRRLYRKADIPTKSVGYMTEIIQWAKFELENGSAAGGGQGEEGQGLPIPYIMTTGNDWELLREMYLKRWGNRAWALYRVPLRDRMTWSDVANHLGEKDGESLAKRAKRRVSRRPDFPPTSKDLGDLGEKFICASLLDIYHPKRIAGSGKPDIILRVGKVKAALSVKFTEKDGKYREREKHPEYDYAPDNAFCVLIRPRLLEMRLYRLTDYEQTINSNKGERLATTEALVTRLRELIDSG
jgi:hypothetical protein